MKIEKPTGRWTYFDPKLCVLRWPSENFVDCPLLSRIELDLAGETLSDAMPDSKLLKLFAACVMEVEAFRCVCWFFGGGSNFKDFLKKEENLKLKIKISFSFPYLYCSSSKMFCNSSMYRTDCRYRWIGNSTGRCE